MGTDWAIVTLHLSHSSHSLLPVHVAGPIMCDQWEEDHKL